MTKHALIHTVQKQILDSYRQCAVERKRLHKLEWEAKWEFSVLGEIEVFGDDIAGYASWILSDQLTHSKAASILVELRKRDFAKLSLGGHITNVLMGAFPLLITHVELIDYLRLLMIEQVERILSERTAKDEAAIE